MIETPSGIFYAIHLQSFNRDGNKGELHMLGEFATFREALQAIEAERVKWEAWRDRVDWRPYGLEAPEVNDERGRMHAMMCSITVDEIHVGRLGWGGSVVWSGIQGKCEPWLEAKRDECLARAVNEEVAA